MEAQAQEEVEREVACDVTYSGSEPGPGRLVETLFYADVGGQEVRSVSARLTSREVSEDYVPDEARRADVMLTTDAIVRDGRTLIRCGRSVAEYDSMGEIQELRSEIYRIVQVVASDSL